MRNVAPLETLVMDEAVQLKECESAIPLQFPAIKHAILFGDECELPAMVESKEMGYNSDELRKSQFNSLLSCSSLFQEVTTAQTLLTEFPHPFPPKQNSIYTEGQPT
ncbi:regulator of nonsense transcripts 1-like protein [Cucumis melo var. makuwa]|uniref:Regulator of nonsense transcripts 1-like protein n=1 Tax=Cucumis melo var. makuwa TaxID=1194695 RepID=A0A5A7TSI2_CUCMM|nr:regulator of nonsense transcripts 1-like protein [Cucumis melo var. makuwa]